MYRLIGNVQYLAGHGMSVCSKRFEILIGLGARVADGAAANVKQAGRARDCIRDIDPDPMLPDAVVYLGGSEPLLRGHPKQVIAAARDALLCDELVMVMAVGGGDIGIERGLPIGGARGEAHQEQRENKTPRS